MSYGFHIPISEILDGRHFNLYAFDPRVDRSRAGGVIGGGGGSRSGDGKK